MLLRGTPEPSPVRSLGLSLAWLLAGAALYGSSLALEFYWNVYNWAPKYDALAIGLLFGLLAACAGLTLLGRATNPLVPRLIGTLVCTALAVLGLYILPPESLTEGLLGRIAPSPLWYRLGRALLLATPLIAMAALKLAGKSAGATTNGPQ